MHHGDGAFIVRTAPIAPSRSLPHPHRTKMRPHRPLIGGDLNVHHLRECNRRNGPRSAIGGASAALHRMLAVSVIAKAGDILLKPMKLRGPTIEHAALKSVILGIMNDAACLEQPSLLAICLTVGSDVGFVDRRGWRQDVTLQTRHAQLVLRCGRSAPRSQRSTDWLALCGAACERWDERPVVAQPATGFGKPAQQQDSRTVRPA